MKLPLREFADVVAGLKATGDVQQKAEEVRQAARMPIVARIDLSFIENGVLGRAFSVVTRDISLTGIGVLQSVVVKPKREVIMTLPRSTVPLYVAAKAMHSRSVADGLFTVGFEFERILPNNVVHQLFSGDAAERARLAKSILG